MRTTSAQSGYVRGAVQAVLASIDSLRVTYTLDGEQLTGSSQGAQWCRSTLWKERTRKKQHPTGTEASRQLSRPKRLKNAVFLEFEALKCMHLSETGYWESNKACWVP